MSEKRRKKSNRPQVKRSLSAYCTSCGEKKSWVKNKVTHQHEWRDVTHDVVGSIMQCRHCNATTTTDEQDQQWLKDIRLAHAQWLKKEVAKSRSILGYSVRDFDRKTAISASTISRINRADTLVDASTEALLLETLWKLISEHDIQTIAHQVMPVSQPMFSWGSFSQRQVEFSTEESFDLPVPA